MPFLFHYLPEAIAQDGAVNSPDLPLRTGMAQVRATALCCKWCLRVQGKDRAADVPVGEALEIDAA